VCEEPRPEWLTPEVVSGMGDWPDKEVARACGVSRRSVTRWRNRLGIESRRATAQRERASLVPHIQKQVDYWRGRFRVLQGWSITVVHDLVYADRVKSIDVEHKRAVIYTGQGLPVNECDELGVPIDYALHEVLHIAWEAARNLGPKDGEEILIQDLCWILTHK